MLYDAVMVPFDGSDSACAALDEAVRFAKEDAGLALHVVQIVDLERTAVAKLEARGVDLTESVVPMVCKKPWRRQRRKRPSACMRRSTG